LLPRRDSLTFGTAEFGQPPHPYTLTLEKQLKQKFPGAYSVWTAGDPGETTGEMNGRLPELLFDADECLDICIILGGTNDLASTAKVPYIWTNLQSLYKLVKNHSPNCCIIGLTIPQCFCQEEAYIKDRDSVNNQMRAYFEDEKNGRMVDIEKLIPFSQGEGSLFCSDGLHFSPAGYDLIGLEIFKVIEKRNGQLKSK